MKKSTTKRTTLILKGTCKLKINIAHATFKEDSPIVAVSVQRRMKDYFNGNFRYSFNIVIIAEELQIIISFFIHLKGLKSCILNDAHLTFKSSEAEP